MSSFDPPPNPSASVESPNPVESPCVRLCVLSQSGVCMGCYRTGDEIGRWSRADAKEKQAILAATQKRRFQAAITQ